MPKNNSIETMNGSFHLNKWYLDFIGENGEAMIFYAAKLTWHGISVSYTSWLQYDAATEVHVKSRFRDVNMPQKKDGIIVWNDLKFGVSGRWSSLANMLQAKIYDSEYGSLDWKCYQPTSKVQLKIGDKYLAGKGYAEQLILTTPPWNIPMDELRWGRFGSNENTIVWIELREKEKKQWLWLNGDKIENSIIEDECIIIPHKDHVLYLNSGIVLEEEKKIFSVVEKIVRYIPGFKKVVPIKFLMADEYKWLSKGELHSKNKIISKGMAIHELVNFKTRSI
jgi:hypothetical protein